MLLQTKQKASIVRTRLQSRHASRAGFILYAQRDNEISANLLLSLSGKVESEGGNYPVYFLTHKNTGLHSIFDCLRLRQSYSNLAVTE